MNLAYKVLQSKLLEGKLEAGTQICIQIDQTLTQDSTGTMAYLQLEAMDIGHVAVEKAVAYIDHNMLQTGFENMDDHEFIRSVAKKHGITFSKPGNGVCHQLQLENFAKPGKTLVGSDSHTPTCGAMGMIAIGAGGLDVAVAMATGKYYLQCPSVIQVNLTGKKAPWVSAKDIILKVFAHNPAWLRMLYAIRACLVKPFGIETKAIESEELIIEEDKQEAIMRKDDKHLLFYVDIFITPLETGKQMIEVTTLVKYHNWVGKAYFFCVKPFHRIIVPLVLKKALC